MSQTGLRGRTDDPHPISTNPVLGRERDLGLFQPLLSPLRGHARGIASLEDSLQMLLMQSRSALVGEAVDTLAGLRGTGAADLWNIRSMRYARCNQGIFGALPKMVQLLAQMDLTFLGRFVHRGPVLSVPPQQHEQGHRQGTQKQDKAQAQQRVHQEGRGRQGSGYGAPSDGGGLWGRTKY